MMTLSPSLGHRPKPQSLLSGRVLQPCRDSLQRAWGTVMRRGKHWSQNLYYLHLSIPKEGPIAFQYKSNWKVQESSSIWVAWGKIRQLLLLLPVFSIFSPSTASASPPWIDYSHHNDEARATIPFASSIWTWEKRQRKATCLMVLSCIFPPPPQGRCCLKILQLIAR